MQNIRKMIISLIGVSIILINSIWGVDLLGMEAEITEAVNQIITVVVGILTVVGVYRVPNGESS